MYGSHNSVAISERFTLAIRWQIWKSGNRRNHEVIGDVCILIRCCKGQLIEAFAAEHGTPETWQTVKLGVEDVANGGFAVIVGKFGTAFSFGQCSAAHSAWMNADETDIAMRFGVGLAGDWSECLKIDNETIKVAYNLRSQFRIRAAVDAHRPVDCHFASANGHTLMCAF